MKGKIVQAAKASGVHYDRMPSSRSGKVVKAAMSHGKPTGEPGIQMRSKSAITKAPYRESATTMRGKKYGMANQMSHEMAGKMQRDEMMNAMKSRGMAAKSAHASRMRNKASETGANAGTYGGSRAGLLSAFFGKRK